MFRLGDFYEMFFEDARIAARVLDIALTSRRARDGERGADVRRPLPRRRGYVARLVGAGHRVALCDQVEDASKAKGLVRREVIRVVSPGLVTDPGALDARANLYLAALARSGDTIGCAYADLSTGELRVSEESFSRARGALALQFAIFRLGDPSRRG